MNNNISEKLQKELEGIFKNRFFFVEPSNKKIIAYSATFLILVLLGSLLNMEMLAAFLAVFPLIYVLGARGLKLYLPLVFSGVVILLFTTSVSMVFWFVVHIFLAYVIYYAIIKRRSKIYIISLITVVLFFAVSVYITILIQSGLISINPENITEFINSYVEAMLVTNQTIDKDLLLLSFENLKRTFPVTIFVSFFIYCLALLQYTLTLLAREYIIIPAFPKLSNIVVSGKMGYLYIGITIIELIVSSTVEANSYDFWYIVLQNTTSILSYIFVLNGLFTAFFFAEQRENSQILKIFAVVAMVILSPLMELVGFIDCIFKLRANYIIMKRGD